MKKRIKKEDKKVRTPESFAYPNYILIISKTQTKKQDVFSPPYWYIEMRDF